MGMRNGWIAAVVLLAAGAAQAAETGVRLRVSNLGGEGQESEIREVSAGSAGGAVSRILDGEDGARRYALSASAAPGALKVRSALSVAVGADTGLTPIVTSKAHWNDIFSIDAPVDGIATFAVGLEATQQATLVGSSLSDVMARLELTTSSSRSVIDPENGETLIVAFSSHILDWTVVSGGDPSYDIVTRVKQYSLGSDVFDDFSNPADMNGIWYFEVPFLARLPIDFGMEVRCDMLLRAENGGSANASCDMGNSAYWLGLVALRDPEGNAIPGSISSLSGFSFADAWNAQPGGVVPEPGGVIPEPGVWAMMIAGFGLVGGVVRRRSADAERMAA